MKCNNKVIENDTLSPLIDERSESLSENQLVTLFFIIYKFLCTLEACIEIDNFIERDNIIDATLNKAGELLKIDISPSLRKNIAILLSDAGLIKGFCDDQYDVPRISFTCTRITLAGLEYLHSNPNMSTAGAMDYILTDSIFAAP